MSAPRTQERALALAHQSPVTKYDIPYVHQRTAQRALQQLHEHGLVHIAAWVPIYRQRVPAYRAGTGKDALKPKPVSNKMRMRRRRKDPEFYMDERLKRAAVSRA